MRARFFEEKRGEREKKRVRGGNFNF